MLPNNGSLSIMLRPGHRLELISVADLADIRKVFEWPGHSMYGRIPSIISNYRVRGYSRPLHHEYNRVMITKSETIRSFAQRMQ